MNFRLKHRDAAGSLQPAGDYACLPTATCQNIGVLIVHQTSQLGSVSIAA
jgi:hypothetical protein